MAFGNTLDVSGPTAKATDLLDLITIRRLRYDETGLLFPLNQQIFNEKRLINTLDHPILIPLVAEYQGMPVGFKIGYGLSRRDYYSAKGGVLKSYRRHGIARILLYRMILEAAEEQFEQFVYDTFPNRFPGMYHLGLREKFKIEYLKWNAVYDDYQVRLRRAITPR